MPARIRLRGIGAGLAGCALILALPAWAAAQDADAMQRVQQSYTANQHITYIGEMETLRFRSRRVDATIVRIEHRRPDLTRRWYLAPPALFGDSVVSRDSKTYEFDKQHRVFIQSARPWHEEFPAGNRFALISRNYRAVLGGSSIVAGQRVHRITLLLRASGRRAITLWIDDRTGFPLERETYRSDGSITFRMRFSSIRYLADLPETLFATAAPRGYRVTQNEAAFSAANEFAGPREMPAVIRSATAPLNLPDGFRIVRVTVTRVGGIPARHAVYSDGVRTLSLFESPLAHMPSFGHDRPQMVRIHAVEGRYLEDGNDSLLTWSNATTCLTLVGNLSKDELIEIAQSLP